ncbi:uncharacterized protein LOC110997909 isoform X1 [Pieris rapae]|uniref:uncharacterized protein LOC110997909 isoform X1 n=2 Tax=Pieris rapae TaxID=64459 RepID=UPI001E279F9E|nr:uncharacterized protein LOC110997909 isoform X1 [Pieris rapae]
MDSVLLVVTTVLCTLLLLKLIYNLRSTLRWRVNCWFCNSNFWVKFINRNSWTCPNCEQYNGFTKDGDYNKPIVTANNELKAPNAFKRSPPKNGLCKMCNINQQLKVTQLANFVPMNEKNFEHEIEMYKSQLEKAYKLCSPCKQVIQMKLHKEKESMLGSKLLQNRTPKKSKTRKEKRNDLLHHIINNVSKAVAGILIVLVTVEFYENIKVHDNIYSTINNVKVIIYNLIERVLSIVKMKTLMTFPQLEHYFYDFDNTLYVDFITLIAGHNRVIQKALSGFVCAMQIIGHFWNINKLKYSIGIDLLWTVFVATFLYHKLTGHLLIISSIKLCAVVAVLFIYNSIKSNNKIDDLETTPKKTKKPMIGSIKMHQDQDISFDTDDDVSLSKFGLHNFTSSSNETLSPLNSSFKSGRSFTPRNDSLWNKPMHNSTFTINSMAKSPSPFAKTVFVKPEFNKYQKLVKDESDSDLDESISSLCISSPKKRSAKTNPVFALRKFTASPNFATPMPINRGRPLISPSKLGTSWVAGGYWGSDGERSLFNINGSRSSSQSSGFESQTSSMTQRNVFSQPPSREESVCGEPDRSSVLLDRFQNCNMNYQSSQNFAPLSTPVFPQMQYNNHVKIPQPRFPQSFSNNYSSEHNFKIPGRSGIIKLPQIDSFTSN